jgi:hypothetical protein
MDQIAKLRRQLEEELVSVSLSGTTRHDLDVVGAVMLYPDDDEARTRAKQTTLTALLREYAQDLQPDILISLIGFAADATPLIDIHKQVKHRFISGCRAGLYLREVVKRAATGVKMEAIVQDICAPLGGDFGKIERQTFYNHVWSPFRVVSHFWAASLDLNFDRVTAVASGVPFPCSFGELPQFFALAEGYRHLAERTKSRRAKRAAILVPGESARRAVPELVLPEFAKK